VAALSGNKSSLAADLGWRILAFIDITLDTFISARLTSPERKLMTEKVDKTKHNILYQISQRPRIHSTLPRIICYYESEAWSLLHSPNKLDLRCFSKKSSLYTRSCSR
jgi:hypothetical protein